MGGIMARSGTEGAWPGCGRSVGARGMRGRLKAGVPLAEGAFFWYHCGMEPVKLDLDEADRDWIDKRVAEGGYTSPADVVRDLIRREQIRLEREAIDKKLLEALDSGSRITTEKDWENLRQRLEERIQEHHGKRAG